MVNKMHPVKVRPGLCCAGMVAVLSGCSGGEEAPIQAKLPVVQVMELPAPSLDKRYKFNGVLESNHKADLSFRVAGAVEEILAHEGTPVVKGQLIARLDPHDFKVSVLELEAKQAEINAAHRLAVTELARVKMAMGDRAIASVQLDRAVSGEARARAGVELVAQSLQKAKDSLRYSELIAPFDGVIGKVYVDQNELINTSSRIVTIHQPERLDAVVDVPESLIWNLQLGQKGNIAWFNASQSIPALVTKIATVPDRLKRTYEVTFSLENAPKNLVAGKAVSATVNLPYLTETPVFCLPARAVVSQNAQLQVGRVAEGKAHFVPVSVISQADDSLCVAGDLQQGERIVLSGAAFVQEGQDVSILTGKAAAGATAVTGAAK